MSDLSPAEIESRIKRQRMLLKERAEEYKMFGRTASDADQDRAIYQEIKILEARLATNHPQGE